VYGLFQNHARTPQGKLLLRQYFLRPSQDIEVINARLYSIYIFIKPENATSLLDLTKNLAQVRLFNYPQLQPCCSLDNVLNVVYRSKT
jgi:DNA mismatch repair protein MSH5